MKLKFLLATAKKYGFKSFFVKSFFAFFAILLVPFLLFSIAISRFQYKNITAIMSHSIESNIIETAKFTDQLFDEINDFYFNTSTSQSVDIMLNKVDFSSMLVNSCIKDFYEMSSNLCKRNDVIDSVYLYSKANEYVFSNARISSSDLKRFDDGEFIKSLPQKDTAIYSRSLYINNRDNYNYLTFSMPIHSYDSWYGILILNINADLLYSKYKDFNTYMYNYYLADNNDMVIASNLMDSIDTDVSKTFSTTDYNNIRSSDLSYSIVDHNGKYLSSKKMNNPYTLICQNENPTIGEQFNNVRLRTTIIVLLVLLLNALISLILTTYFYQFIAILVTAFEKPNNISDSKILKLGSYNEISFLLNTVIKYSDRSNLDSEFKKRIDALKKQHSLGLQAQINPHFVSNTLNAINSVALKTFKCETPVTAMISHLSEVLRYTFRISDNVVSLNTELDYLNHYIEIEKIKNNNKINFIYNIDENTLSNPVLKLSLQPIVENAIFHGVKNSGGTITISSYYENSSMVVKISDNGNGINEQTLSEINTAISLKNDIFELPKKHIGIVNTHKRINLLWGEHYGCRVTSHSGETTVCLVFPKQ